MEHSAESRRLLAQEQANPSLERLRLTGLTAGQAALDMGCGPGAVTSAMAALVGPKGSVTAADPSPERLEEARRRLFGLPQVRFEQAALPGTGLPAASFDYVWCQFVLEYLAEPTSALGELARLTRPGGKVVVSEIDGFGLAYWPAPAVVERGRATFLDALAKTGFDLFIGRKLFHHFHALGLADVKVHLSPFHVTAGAADEQLEDDWRTRFEALSPVMVPAFGGPAPWREFQAAYLALLADPTAFKYSVILTAEGTRR